MSEMVFCTACHGLMSSVPSSYSAFFQCFFCSFNQGYYFFLKCSLDYQKVVNLQQVAGDKLVNYFITNTGGTSHVSSVRWAITKWMCMCVCIAIHLSMSRTYFSLYVLPMAMALQGGNSKNEVIRQYGPREVC